MKFILTILLCIYGFSACTQDPITINNGAPTVTINNGPPTVTVNYAVSDDTFLQWEEIGPNIEFYNDLKGIRKKSTAASGYSELHIAWAKQPFIVGDTLIMKVSTTPNKALWVYLDSDKYSFNASDVTFYDFAVVLGNGETSNVRAYDGSGALGAGNTAIAAGNLISIVYESSTSVKFQKSIDGGSNWSTIYTSALDPADILYAGVKMFTPLAAVDEIYKNRAIAYTYPTPLSPKQGLTIGNSTVGTYGSATEPISYFMHTAPERNAGFFTDNIAVSGHTIATQTTAWNNYSNKANIDFIIIQLGHNDLHRAQTAVQLLAEFQIFINLINSTKKAGAKIIVGSILPCRSQLIASWGEVTGEAYYQKLLSMNTGFASLSGIDMSITTNYDEMEDGSTGNLASPYDIGDGLHENNLGRFVIGSRSFRPALAQINILSE